MSGAIRPATDSDFDAILAVVNEAAVAYRGVIPADCWHEPYMPAGELAEEIAAGVAFSVLEEGDTVLGVMGLQDLRDVALIRHAYVRPGRQGEGIGSRLLAHVVRNTRRPLLVGTWAAATWAVRFYERHGFFRVSAAEKDRLLKTYWSIPERQIETSVVLADSRHRTAVDISRHEG